MTLSARIVSTPHNVAVPTVVPVVASVAGLRSLVGGAGIPSAIIAATATEAGAFTWSAGSATDDGVTRYNAGGVGSSGPGWARVYSGPIDVRFAGAKGDGSADDTAAFQRALSALDAQGGGELFAPLAANYYKISDELLPGSNTTVRCLGELRQTGAGKNLFKATGKTNLVFESCKFKGIVRVVGASNESALDLTSCSRVVVRGCRFEEFAFAPLYAKGCSDVEFSENYQYRGAYGVRFRGVTRGTIARNTVNDTSLANSDFTIGIYLDSTDGHAFGICSDISIVGNTLVDLPGGAAINGHTGDRLTIANNVMKNVGTGVSMNPFNVNDMCRDITISGNVVECTTEAGLAGANYGIDVVGDPSFSVSQVSIVGNTIRKANKVNHDTGGGIGLQYINGVVVSANVIEDCYGAGIAFVGNGVKGFSGDGNQIRNIVGAVGDAVGIRIQTSTTSFGRLTNTVIDGADVGVRFDGAAIGMHIHATFKNVTTSVANNYRGTVNGVRVYQAGETTFDVAAQPVYLRIAQSVPTTITNFTNAIDGQRLTLIFADNKTTISVTNFFFAGNAEYHSAADSILVLSYSSALSKWVEETRAGNAPNVVPYTAGDTTPTVSNGGVVTYMTIANASPTTITNFDDGSSGQILVLKFSDGNTTIDRSNSEFFNTANFTSSANETLILVNVPGPLWLEASRSSLPDASASTKGLMSSSDKSKLDAATSAATGATLALRDASGGAAFDDLSSASMNVSGLTASQAVVTDSSKNLASLAYALSGASTLIKRDASGGDFFKAVIGTYSDGATTPSVTDVNYLAVVNSSPTTITNFTGGVEGQILILRFADSNTTVDRSNAVLAGGANFVSTNFDILVLVKGTTYWHEIARSANS